ncbi:hypothetical protein niasHS_000062 [Heterodera schachtii]|uniref:Uncharacterized protein n=1 Tax=Heterodera schachtii TaxID=97005 RepID=A0ABD2KCH5_HETSC
MDFAIGRIALNGECQKDFFGTADQLEEMASGIFAASDKQTENGKFMEKAFVGILCCITIKAQKDSMEKDELALIDEFEANQRNFCHQLKKGQNIWGAVKSPAGNAIVTAARNVKVNSLIHEEGLRKLEKMQNLSSENQREIGTFAKHCFATLKLFQQFITDERLAQTLFAGGGQTVSDQSSALSAQTAPTISDQLPKGKSSRRRKRSSKWPKCLGAFALAGFSGYMCTLFWIILARSHINPFTYFSADDSSVHYHHHIPLGTAVVIAVYMSFAVSLVSIFLGIYHCFVKRSY